MDELIRLWEAVLGPVYDAVGPGRFFGGLWLVGAVGWVALMLPVWGGAKFSLDGQEPNWFDRLVVRVVRLGVTVMMAVMSAVTAWELWGR